MKVSVPTLFAIRYSLFASDKREHLLRELLRLLLVRIVPGALDRVSDCVTEIQKRTLTCLVALVFPDDSGFDLDVALDQPL